MKKETYSGYPMVNIYIYLSVLLNCSDKRGMIKTYR